jgi:FkbM family methyltransferase
VAAEPHPGLAASIAGDFSAEVSSGRLVVLEQGLDSAPRRRHLMIAGESSMSSMSPDFVRISRENGDAWLSGAPLVVETTTLDTLVDRYGPPAFCKIDVEGMDDEVLGGLSRAVRAVSFEYNTQPVLIDVAIRCLDRLEELGAYEYNYETGNEYRLELPDWVGGPAMRKIISSRLSRNRTFGDVIARLY